MKNLSVFLLLLASAPLYAAPSVERVVVRQQWPWSMDVKVEYSLVGVDEKNPVDISVSVFNGDVDLTSARLNDAITGDRYYITEPVGSFTIDPITAFGTEKVALGNFKVKLTLAPSPANMNEILYKVVDLNSPYTVTDVRRYDFYNGKMGEYVTSYQDIDPEFSTSLENVLIWTGVTKDDDYKTDKMVFRRIPAAGKSFMMFTNNAVVNVNGGVGTNVWFTKDYYIAVFEMTQTQVKKFYSSFQFNETNKLYSAMRAASAAKLAGYYTQLRSGTNANIPWPEDSDHTIAQKNTSLVGNMQKKTGLCIDLPTEAMWEYACRAGTDTRLYTGHASKKPVYNDSHTKKIMRVVDVNGQGDTAVAPRNCDLSRGPNIPGCYKPNAFGLYDMFGNLWEWCLDRYISASKVKGGEDPLGPTSEETSNTGKHVLRGGSYRWNATYVEDRLDRTYSYGTEDHGIRLCIWLTYNEDGTLQK